MNIVPIKTKKVTSNDKNIINVLNEYLPEIKERSIVAITSKIISITEGRVVAIGSIDKDRLIKQESEYYLSREENKFNVSLTIARNNLVATAGIDESNGDGNYVLWPKDPQQSANTIREHLKKKFNLKEIGVIITDSKTTPLRWGVAGFALAHSGFLALKNYIGKEDLFGRKFEYEMLNIADSLAAAATLVMGEGAEQTPIAIMSDLNNVQFQDRNPTEGELKSLKITLDEDLYAPLLKAVKWRKGLSEPDLAPREKKGKKA